MSLVTHNTVAYGEHAIPPAGHLRIMGNNDESLMVLFGKTEEEVQYMGAYRRPMYDFRFTIYDLRQLARCARSSRAEAEG